jgi:gas vesicle protein
MSTLLKDAQSAASEGLEYASETAEDAWGGAKRGAASAKGAAERSASSLLGTALQGFSAAAGLVATLRRFDMDHGLSWFGLARRRSPLVTVAFFGTGILIGAGIGCLIAPVSGAEARRAIRERWDDYIQRGARAIRRGERALEHEAEELAAKAASEVARTASEVAKTASEVAKAASEVQKVATHPAADRPNGRATANATRS